MPPPPPAESEQDGLSRAIVRVVDRKIDVVQKHAGALLRRGGGDQALIESVDASVARRRLGLRKDGGDVGGAAASVRQSIEDNRERLSALENALGEASLTVKQGFGSRPPTDVTSLSGYAAAEESSELTWTTSEESDESFSVSAAADSASTPPVRGFSAALRAAASKADADSRVRAVREREAAVLRRSDGVAGVRRSVSFHEEDEDEMERRTRALRFAVSSMLPPTSTSHVGRKEAPAPGTVTTSTPVSPRSRARAGKPTAGMPGIASAPVSPLSLSPVSGSPPPGRVAPAVLPAVSRRPPVARSSSVADIQGMMAAAARNAAKAAVSPSSVTRSAPVSPQALSPQQSRASSPLRGEPSGYASSPLSREGSDAELSGSPMPRSHSAMAMRRSRTRSPSPSPIMARLARSSSQIQLAKLDQQALRERDAASLHASGSPKIGRLASPASDDGAMWTTSLLERSKSLQLPPRASSMSPQLSFLARSASVGSPASPDAPDTFATREPLSAIGEAATPSPTIIQRRKGVTLTANTSTDSVLPNRRSSPLTGRAVLDSPGTPSPSRMPTLALPRPMGRTPTSNTPKSNTPKSASPGSDDSGADSGLDVAKARLVNKKRIVNYSVGGHSKVVEYHADAPEGVSIGEQAKQLMLKESRRRQELLESVQ